MDNSKQTAPSKSVSSELYKLQDYAKNLLPQKHRIQVCQSIPSYWAQIAGTHGGVSRKDDGNHHLHGFGSCGDSRACQLCANKIGIQRAEEVKAVLRWHRQENSGVAVLVTYTCSHKKETDLKILAQSLAKAKRDFSSYTAIKNCKLVLGYVNLISARDMTFSFNNGHHPHYHDIWLVGSAFLTPHYFGSLPTKLKNFCLRYDLINDDFSISLEKVKLFLSNQWILACTRNDLVADMAHGFDIQYRKTNGADAVGSYILKWAYELSTPHKKVGRRGAMTPIQLLSKVYDDEGRYHHKYARPWIDYIEAFAGMSSIYFGKGLKLAAGIEEVTDEELADRPLPVSVREFTHAERLAVVYYRSQRKVVFYFDNYSQCVADAYLDELVRQYYNQKNSEIKMRWHLKKQIAQSSAKIMAELFIQQVEEVVYG